MRARKARIRLRFVHVILMSFGRWPVLVYWGLCSSSVVAVLGANSHLPKRPVEGKHCAALAGKYWITNSLLSLAHLLQTDRRNTASVIPAYMWPVCVSSIITLSPATSICTV